MEKKRKNINLESNVSKKRKNLNLESNVSKKKKKFEKCAICLKKLDYSEFLYILPCKHSFHRECIKGWLKIKNICPYCKKQVKYNKDSILEQLVNEVADNIKFNLNIKDIDEL